MSAQLGIGIVHFLTMRWLARYKSLRTDLGVGKALLVLVAVAGFAVEDPRVAACPAATEFSYADQPPKFIADLMLGVTVAIDRGAQEQVGACIACRSAVSCPPR